VNHTVSFAGKKLFYSQEYGNLILILAAYVIGSMEVHLRQITLVSLVRINMKIVLYKVSQAQARQGKGATR